MIRLHSPRLGDPADWSTGACVCGACPTCCPGSDDVLIVDDGAVSFGSAWSSPWSWGER